jgi:hypothetical protein
MQGCLLESLGTGHWAGREGYAVQEEASVQAAAKQRPTAHVRRITTPLGALLLLLAWPWPWSRGALPPAL